MLGRRILSEEEKRTVLEHWHYQCYICQGDIIYADEAEFVHQIPLDQGGTFDLSNYVPLHDYCYRKVDDQELVSAREETQISAGFSPDFNQLFEARRAEPTIDVDRERMMASVDDEGVRLYHCPNTGIHYFYHSIPVSYLEVDTRIIPRGLDRGRVARLGGHLQDHHQLSPVICRLEGSRLLVVSGLHRAAAQYLGNQNLRVDCKVLVGADEEMVGRAVAASRRDLRSRGRKAAPLTDWLLREFRDDICGWQEVHPQGDLSESLILHEILHYRESQAVRCVEAFLEHWLKDTLAWKKWSEEVKSAALVPAESMATQLVQAFMEARSTPVVMESDDDYRSEETENMGYLVDIMGQEGLFRVAPGVSRNIPVIQTQMREEAVIFWVRLLGDAVRIILQRRPDTGICYGPHFTGVEKARIILTVRKLFSHPFWQDLDLDRAFRLHDHEYIDEASRKWGLNHLHLLRF